jgi:magnesium chelatase family protein
VRELRDTNPGEPTPVVAARVAMARRVQQERFRETGISTNAAMTPGPLRDCARLDEAGARLLGRALQGLGLSARAHDGIIRVARTIADLEGAPKIHSSHVAEAIQYRCLDRPVLGSREAG